MERNFATAKKKNYIWDDHTYGGLAWGLPVKDWLPKDTKYYRTFTCKDEAINYANESGWDVLIDI